MRQLLFTFFNIVYFGQSLLWADGTPATTDSSYWKGGVELGFNAAQATFSSNWKSGGTHNISRLDFMATAKLTKFLSTNFTAIAILDKNQDKNWQMSQVFGVGLACKR